TLSGTITVVAEALDDIGIVGVQFKVDGSNLGTEVTTAPYTMSWDTATAAIGAHTLTAVARDAAGNVSTSPAVSVTKPDLTPPTVSITAPLGGTTVAQTITVSAAASDNLAVAGVQFKLDGVNLGAEDTSAPFSLSWNTTLASNGPHSLTAVARDAAGNTTTSAAISATVDNAAPIISSVASSSIGSSSGTISWTTNEASDTQVEYGTSLAYGQISALNSAMVTSHNISLIGLSASTLFHHRVRSKDGSGNLAVSGDFTFTTQAAPDTTPPTVSVTAPANGATVSGTVTVSASTSDNVGVAGVQFKLDGANLGAEDTSNSHSVSWNTTAAANGPHTLAAVARDAAGNTATSAAVNVTVSNSVPDTTPPTVPTGLTATAVSLLQINLTWTGSTDNVGVAGYKIYRGGNQVGTSVSTTYSDTGLLPVI